MWLAPFPEARPSWKFSGSVLGLLGRGPSFARAQYLCLLGIQVCNSASENQLTKAAGKQRRSNGQREAGILEWDYEDEGRAVRAHELCGSCLAGVDQALSHSRVDIFHVSALSLVG